MILLQLCTGLLAVVIFCSYMGTLERKSVPVIEIICVLLAVKYWQFALPCMLIFLVIDYFIGIFE